MHSKFPLACVAVLSLPIGLQAQMEKRDRELFARSAFEQQAPALGSPAPDLALETLDGRPWSLLQRLGKTVVLVKASFT